MGERREGGGDGFQGSDQRAESLPAERRLVELMAEFRRRQRRRPDLVVRPWWTPGGEGIPGRVGFVVEYCPTGSTSAEMAVRLDRVTVDGPAGSTDAVMELGSGWFLNGSDTKSPETLANHLLKLADRTLGDAPGDAA
jgi:hypothetical protein